MPRMCIFLVVVSAFLSISMNSWAQINEERVFLLRLKAENHSTRSEMANYMHFDIVKDKEVQTTLNEADYAIVKKKFSQYILEEKVISIPQPLKGDDGVVDFPRSHEGYHTYDKINKAFDSLIATHQSIVSKVVLGKTVDDEPIIGLNITGQKGEKKNGMIVTGMHHAREHLSTEVPFLLAKWLVEQYGKDQQITDLINNRDLYIFPVLNPDGKSHDIIGRRFKHWRKNRSDNSNGSKGVDLNRNYGYLWGTGGSSDSPNSDIYMGPGPFSEPETSAVKNFIEQNKHIKIFLSFHSYSKLILYPWGHQSDGVGGRDEQVFVKMANKMATWNKYKPQQSHELYKTSGDTCDWAWGEHRIFCFTFELPPGKWDIFAGGFYPKPTIIRGTVEENKQPLLYLMRYAEDPYQVLN